jgi:hypothetical protein
LPVPNRQLWLRSLAMWVKYSLDLTNVFNVVAMEFLSIAEIYAWDRGYDRISTIERIEPRSEEVAEVV